MYEYDAAGNIILLTDENYGLYKSQSMDSLTNASRLTALVPNPTNGISNIEMSNLESEDIFVTVTDLQGNRFMATHRVENNVLDISSLKNGWYIVTIESGNINEKHKILKYSR
ncbi:MAG: T9SS type A sorting domain-containing protein [Muribaculum sp.]|nr:T9SS type A sorting domain-containing protein [Muribaculum sp.]